jgi:predicted DNA-binding protein
MSTNLNIRLEPELMNALRSAADRAGQPLSWFVREALEKKVNTRIDRKRARG